MEELNRIMNELLYRPDIGITTTVVTPIEDLQGNEDFFADIMAEFNCTYDEAYDMVEWDLYSLEELHKVYKQNAAYDKLKIEAVPGFLEFLRDEYYSGKNISDADLKSEAEEMTEEHAYMVVYDWEQY